MHENSSISKNTSIYGLSSFIESAENNKLYSQQCAKYIYITQLASLQFKIKFVDIMYLNKNKLQKHDDFMRRLSYRYNDIILSADSQGVITTIDNMEDIHSQWSELKSLLIEHYTGDDMEQFLERLTKELYSPESTIKELGLYNWLGLIFAGPRYIHQAANKEEVHYYPVRTIHGTFNVRESVTEIEKKQESTIYKISGQPSPDKNTDYSLIEYDGEIEIQNSNNLILDANLDIMLKVKGTIRTEQYELSYIGNPQS